MEFSSLVAVLFRVEPIVFFGAVCRWFAVLKFEVLSKKRSAVAEFLGALGAMKSHGRGADKAVGLSNGEIRFCW